MFALPIILGLSGLLVNSEDVTSKVLVLGAGASGLTAARTLSENGENDFIILEGSDRPGGRMYSTTWEGQTIEYGANWLQQEYDGILWELVERFGIDEIESDYDNVIVRQNQLYVNDSDIPWDAMDYAWEMATELGVNKSIYQQLLGITPDSGGLDISLRSGFHLGGWDPVTPVDHAIEIYYADFEYAEPPEWTSLINTVGHNDSATDHFVVDPDGFFSLVEDYINDEFALDDARIKYSKVVTRVEYSDENVIVTTGDGSTYTADYAIMTFSIGVLQSDAVEFVPPFPQWKEEALYTFNMAYYLKIFMKFDSAFWDTDAEFILNAHESRGYYPMWQNLDMPHILPGSKMLLVTVFDTEAHRIDRQTDEETLEELYAVLQEMYPNASRPTNITYNRWGSDPLFQGTYSNWPIGATSWTHALLRAPVDRLYFSGEATSSYYNGYVHGAMYAGNDSAWDVLDCMNDGICDDITPDYLPGCMYDAASNYNPDATVDDGSCEFDTVDNAGLIAPLYSVIFCCLIVAVRGY